MYSVPNTMLTKEFIAEMQARLEKDKRQLEADLADYANKQNGSYQAAYPESGGNSEDDNASEITAYADEVSLVDRLESDLRDTVKALESIEKGTYGKCKYCGQEIDQKRLEARPASSACISCKKTLTQEM